MSHVVGASSFPAAQAARARPGRVRPPPPAAPPANRSRTASCVDGEARAAALHARGRRDAASTVATACGRKRARRDQLQDARKGRGAGVRRARHAGVPLLHSSRSVSDIPSAHIHAQRWRLAWCLCRSRRSGEPWRPRASALSAAHCLAAGGLQRRAVLGDQAVLLELADVTVQVGGVDAEFGGDLLDGDPGTVVDQTEDVLLTARLAVAARPVFVRR
jgi:hypothetical protein